MKKSVLVVTALCASTSLFAQKGKVTSANNYKESGKLDKAWEVIQPTLDEKNPAAAKTYAWPRAWEVNADILVAIGKSKDKNVKALVSDPLVKAVESYEKALELDLKHRNKKGIRNKLIFLESDLINTAAEAYNTKDYANAVKYFEATLDMKQLEAYKNGENLIDTAIIFNTALSAQLGKDYEKAIKYYEEAEGYGYRPELCRASIIRNLKDSGDKEGALAAMEAGIAKYPESQDIMVELINYYLEDNKAEEAVKYLDQAIEKDNSNSSFHLTRGSLLERLERYDEARVSYENAIKVKPDEVNAYYNLGIYHYNCGVRQNEVANNVPANDNDTYMKEKAKMTPMFEAAVPYLEKAVELKPDDRDFLEALKVVYFRLNMTEKLNEVKAKLDSM